MTKTMRFTLLILILWSATGIAQEKKVLSLEDAILKARTDLAPRTLDQLTWIPGGNNFSYVADSALMIGSSGKSIDRPLISLDELNAALMNDGPMEHFPIVTWLGANSFRFTNRENVYTFDLEKTQLNLHCELLPEAENIDHDDQQGHVAYTVGNDLFISTPGAKGRSGSVIKVSNDAEDGLVYGQSVHRQEYGINKGTFWSPNGELLAFYRMDERMVTPYQLEQIDTRPSSFRTIRYPMAGQTSHQVKVGVYDLGTGRTIYLNTDGPVDQYLTNISWGPDGKHLYIVHLDRKTENLQLVEYDVRTANATREVIAEHSDIYLEPEHPMHFLPGIRDRFVWWSERDGWQHLYLYDLNKGLIRQLTRGHWEVTEILATSADGECLIVAGTGSDARERHIYRVDVGSGTTTKISRNAGTHAGLVNDACDLVIDLWSSIDVPGIIEVLDRDGSQVKQLLRSEDPLRELAIGKIEFVEVTANNGDKLFGRMIKPSDLEPAKRYPVIIYVYNGPHVQLVTNEFLGGASHWMLEAAERGYIVFTLDGHGSGHRGLGFEQVVHRQLGKVEVEDQLSGVNYLRSLPYVDPARMAVHGWSYGGFMTISLLQAAPGTFKVGVAGGPVTDWNMYEVMYTERYMDTPEENPEGYRSTSRIGHIEDLEDHLLVVHGLEDDVVLPEHSYALIKAAVDAGIQLDYFTYPGHPHNVRGKDRVHLMTKVLDHIDRNMM